MPYKIDSVSLYKKQGKINLNFSEKNAKKLLTILEKRFKL